MPAKAKRFYLPAYKYAPERPPYLQDLGNVLTMSGMVYQGMGSSLVLVFPGLDFDHNFTVAKPTLEEWGEIIRQSDDPEIFVGEVGGINKVFQRKSRYVISGDTQQKIWARDNFACVYCGIRMGQRLLTIDHFVPLELGGENEERNYITACRKCNKDKGSLSPIEFCRVKGFDYPRLAGYLISVNGG